MIVDQAMNMRLVMVGDLVGYTNRLVVLVCFRCWSYIFGMIWRPHVQGMGFIDSQTKYQAKNQLLAGMIVWSCLIPGIKTPSRSEKRPERIGVTVLDSDPLVRLKLVGSQPPWWGRSPEAVGTDHKMKVLFCGSMTSSRLVLTMVESCTTEMSMPAVSTEMAQVNWLAQLLTTVCLRYHVLYYAVFLPSWSICFFPVRKKFHMLMSCPSMSEIKIKSALQTCCMVQTNRWCKVKGAQALLGEHHFVEYRCASNLSSAGILAFPHNLIIDILCFPNRLVPCMLGLTMCCAISFFYLSYPFSSPLVDHSSMVLSCRL